MTYRNGNAGILQRLFGQPRQHQPYFSPETVPGHLSALIPPMGLTVLRGGSPNSPQPSISTFFHSQLPGLHQTFLAAEAESFLRPWDEELVTRMKAAGAALAIAREVAASKPPPNGCDIYVTVRKCKVGVVVSWELNAPIKI